MADISSITDINGNTYSLKDTVARGSCPTDYSLTIPTTGEWISVENTVSGSDLVHYKKSVSISGLTPTTSTKVDLMPNANVIAQMQLDEISALWIENDSGSLYAHCLGSTLSASVTMNCIVTEII